jgi:predicted nucleic acid-binding protein
VSATPVTTDAHLAAIAIEHSAVLGTFDRDFDRFSGLRLELTPAHAVHELP